MNLKFLIITICFFVYLSNYGQEDSKDNLSQEEKLLVLKKRGPNLDRYGHLYIGYGFLLGDTDRDSAEIRNGTSSSFTLGWLTKYRINSWYELGFDVSYYYSSFHIKQDSFKLVPNTRIHKREKIVFNNIQLIPFQRFKIKNKHHSTGIFIDLGGYLGYNYRIKHQTIERNSSPGAGKTKTVNLDLDYTEDFSYGAIVRVGFNRVVFYSRYRFSDLFIESKGLPELPRFDIGLTIGIHQ